MTDSKLSLGSLGGLKVFSPEDLEFLKILIYGDSGDGKTTLAATLTKIPACRPGLVIDIEGGSTSIREFKNIELIKPDTFKEVYAIKEELKSLAAKGALPYKTIIVDSSTELQRIGTENVMMRTVAKALENEKDKDPDQPEFGDWAKSHNQFRRILRELRDLPCNVVITALAKTDNSIPSRVKSKPQLNGIMADEIAAAFDVVLYLYKVERNEEVVRVVQSLSTKDIVAKDRTGNLEPYIENPDFETLYPILMKTGE